MTPYDELEAQQKAITEQINKAKSEKDKYLLQKKELDNQIYSVRQQIGVLSDKITLLEGHIAEKEDELQKQNEEIEENYKLLKKRLRVMYKAGNASVLGLVLGAEDFSEFLTRGQVASRVAKHDQELIEEMRAAFDGVCHGSLELLADEVLSRVVRRVNARGGMEWKMTEDV